MGAVRQGRSKASTLYPFGGKENGANQDRAWRRHLLKSMIFMDQVDPPRFLHCTSPFMAQFPLRNCARRQKHSESRQMGEWRN